MKDQIRKRYLHFWDLEPNVYFKLKNEFWSKIQSIIDKNKLTKYKIERYLYAYQSYQLIPVLKLVELISKLKIFDYSLSLDYTEKMIEYVRSGHTGIKIYNPKFPIDLLQKEFSELIGLTLSEGHIHIDKHVLLYNNDINILKTGVSDFEKSLGKLERYTIKKRLDGYGDNRNSVILPAYFGKILIFNLGLKTGSKIENHTSIPRFYMENREKESICYLFRGLFSGDGYVGMPDERSKRLTKQIALTANGKIPKDLKDEIVAQPRLYREYAPRLLLDSIELLVWLGFNVSNPISKGKSSLEEYYRNGQLTYTFCWYIKITNNQNFIKFKNEIAFIDKFHNCRLNQLIDSHGKRYINK